MNVYAVVVTYNRKKLLIECLESILSQTISVDKIIVLNNCSTDGTLDFLREKGYEDNTKVEINTLEKNTGGAGGFYFAMKQAYAEGADWIWLMDDDCIPENNALEELIEASHRYDASFFASSVFGPNGEFMNVPTLSAHKSDNGYKDWYEYLSDGVVRIDAATFVSLLISRDSIYKCGLPHKDFFLWGDDIEYTIRLTKNYKPAYFVGKSKVIHKRIGEKALSLITEENKNRIKLYKYYIRNNLVICHVYYSFSKKILSFIANFLLFWKIVFKAKYKWKKMGAYFKGNFEYVFGKYNRKAFKNRFKNHLN